MKLHSAYLNPFQPFPELEINNRVKASEDGKEKPRHAIEDNMSRAVLSALANAHPLAVSMFLNVLASHDSTVLRPRIEACSQTIRNIEDSNTIEFGLQVWPVAAMKERENLEVLLIGISSSHRGTWTHDQRPAPEYPKPDAWIYVPGKILLVFEFKNDEHPLDATQISAYAHYLKLPTENDDVPQAKAGETLNSAEEAKKVQNACANLVLDASWSTVVEALSYIQQQKDIDGMGRWLCGQAADYVKWHVFPPYRGIKTILEWLNGPDTPDRRNHLRRLVGDMGKVLDTSKAKDENAITFAKNANGGYDFKRGAGSALYVKLMQNGKLLKHDWLDGYGKIDAVLWFWFAENESDQIGLEYYLQAKGSQSNNLDKSAWNNASKRHLACASNFEKLVDSWINTTSPSCLMTVSTVKFNGKKLNWQGGGIAAQDGLYLTKASPHDALNFIKKNRDKLWSFPEVGNGKDCFTIEEAAPKVRKPALSILALLNTGEIAKYDNDGCLQKLLQKAVESIKSR